MTRAQIQSPSEGLYNKDGSNFVKTSISTRSKPPAMFWDWIMLDNSVKPMAMFNSNKKP